MNKPLRVLVVEDSQDDALLTIRELQRGGYDPVWRRVDTQKALRDALVQETWDILLVDYSLPSFNALHALEILKEMRLDLPFIIVSGNIGEQIAVEAMRAGAHDYLMKDNLARLLPAVERELLQAQERRERHLAEETVHRLAFYDPVTHLPNRASVRIQVREALLARQKDASPLAVLLLDLDRFKEINDSLGHVRGDAVLRQVGSRLQETLKREGTLAHLGGDEFVAVLPEADQEASEEMAGRILKAMEAPFVEEGLLLDIGGSIGISLFPHHGYDADLLLRRADIAMHWAKESHQGWAVYAPQKDGYSPQHLSLLGELRQVLERKDAQLFLAYQPKVDLRTGHTGGVEALARWTHPQRGLLLPKHFVPLVERTALIRPFTLHLLDEAMSQVQAWLQEGWKFRTAVNVSVRNLEDPRLVDRMLELLRAHDLPSGSLELEVTESALMSDPFGSVRILSRLKDLGMSLAIDDFGTGYSSLEYLKRLPVDTIKIDQSFIRGMLQDASTASIVRSTINLGHDLGLKVVAEGVENRETFLKLASLGCDEAQGNYLSPPQTPAELVRWATASLSRAKVAP